MDAYDLIDLLIDDLNDGVNGVNFDRDVLETNRPDDWGALELSGEDNAEWADGVLIDQTLTADLWVCLSDRGSRIKRQVQAVLKAFCKAHQAGWKLISRTYLYDLDKVMWRWQISIDGPLGEDPEEEDPEEEAEDPAAGDE